MDEKNRNKRGLEDISHFFLSGQNPPKSPEKGPSDKEQEQEKPVENPGTSRAGNGSPLRVSSKDTMKIKIAHPADAAVRSETNIVETAEEYLTKSHSGHFVSEKKFRSSQFGVPEFTLFNKKEGVILCGKIQKGKGFSDFLLSSLGYYAWLKECLTASSPFFEKRPRVLLYLFCDRFPSQARQIVEQLKEIFSIRLVRYQLIQIPDRPGPIVTFQPILSANGNEPSVVSLKAETPINSPFDNVTEDLSKPIDSQSDISEEEWQVFNRLKERAFKE